MKKLKINFFGEGYVLQKLIFSDDELGYIRKAVNNGFLFEDILHHPEVDLVERTSELKHRGLLNTYKNQIEIWFAGKKLQKFQLNDLNPQFIVFPLYCTTQSQLDLRLLPSGIYIVEREIGLINSFEVLSENFNIENLVFNTTKVCSSISFNSCDGVIYQGQNLISHKTDTVVIEQRYFIAD